MIYRSSTTLINLLYIHLENCNMDLHILVQKYFMGNLQGVTKIFNWMTFMTMKITLTLWEIAPDGDYQTFEDNIDNNEVRIGTLEIFSQGDRGSDSDNDRILKYCKLDHKAT